jgi:signal transduction histidine kinase
VSLPAFWTALREGCARMPRRAEVALEWGDVPTVSFATDPRKLTVMVRNLVGNALKFTERGRVQVALAVDDEAAVVRVADTGIGIRREDQETVFELFRQADGSDSRRFGGTGLGLYIVRQFAQQLGGRVDLESAPGRGTTFTITLPVSTHSASA